ncbi:MAG TPA: DUF4058 family protein [Pirellulales bacterium]|jgi:hypothetical protein|nr:DUF4058 family protein [Pirellulales bacterium]
MPLCDHFSPPLDDEYHWEAMHATWPVMIVSSLRGKLPPAYFAEPHVHSGQSAEIDVVTFEREGIVSGPRAEGNGGVATAVWAPPRPTLVVATDLPAQGVYEVLVYDRRRRARLVAAVEIVSPANKDRPDRRRAFVAKCAGLLRERVSVMIVDIVTTRTPNLYAELLDFVGKSDARVGSEPLYAAACRMTKQGDQWQLEAWTKTLSLQEALPTMPLWLADDLAIPLELEKSYQESCSVLGIAIP